MRNCSATSVAVYMSCGGRSEASILCLLWGGAGHSVVFHSGPMLAIRSCSEHDAKMTPRAARHLDLMVNAGFLSDADTIDTRPQKSPTDRWRIPVEVDALQTEDGCAVLTGNWADSKE